MPNLFVLQGPDKGRTLRTDDDVVIVGRGSSQVPLTDQTVSRRHAELRQVENAWLLEDLNSANGTYLNGVRLQKPAKLKHGDQIRVGSTLLVYGGDESLQQYSRGNIPSDLVMLDAGSMTVDSSIVSSVVSSEDSVVMAAPDTAYAVKAWNVIRELAVVIGSLLPTDQMLARVLDIIYEEVDVDRGVIFVKDEQTGEFIPDVVRFRNRPGQDETDERSIITSRTIINHVVATRESVLCSNVIADKRFRSGKSIQNLGMRSVIVAPIISREQVLGLIHLDCPVTRHTYNDYELKLITAIGSQTGLALENQRLVLAALERERLAAAGETFAYLSHYIKNILQGMRSGAEVLQRGLDKRDFAVTGQGWQIVERNLDRSYNLMLNMLAFSKQREPRLEMLQLNRIIEEAVALVQKQADERKIVLLTDLDDGLPPIPLDYDGIHQVILNLVTNAVDAIAAGNGVITVRSRFDPQRKLVIASVADNGPGVPIEQREKIFQPFFSTKGHGGTGLGLPVSKKIVDELHGTIELRDAAGGGAEFVVSLPLVQDRMPGAGDTLGAEI